ncbi:MAG: hypothetical protein IJV04_04980, partial [Lachnospiraceae bacterium]|nr:hypothetical protein [Lachnospiraceae bacterium]
GGGSSSRILVADKGTKKGGVYIKKGKKKVSYIAPEMKYNAKVAKVPAKIKVGKKTYKVVSVAGYAFTGFDKLRKVKISRKVKKVSKSAFFGCNRKKLKVMH